VSGLNLSRLSKLVKDEMFDKRTIAGLSKFAEEVHEVKVRLVKKREDED